MDCYDLKEVGFQYLDWMDLFMNCLVQFLRTKAHYLYDVGVVLLGVNSVFLHILEGIDNVSSVAAIIVNTVEEVLSTEVQQPACLLGQLALDGPRGTEHPAGATGSLQSVEHSKRS